MAGLVPSQEGGSAGRAHGESFTVSRRFAASFKKEPACQKLPKPE